MQLFSCELYEIFKTTFFTEHPQANTSDLINIILSLGYA